MPELENKSVNLVDQRATFDLYENRLLLSAGAEVAEMGAVEQAEQVKELIQEWISWKKEIQ